MLLLDHTGARSGTKRTRPLLYIRDGDDLVIVASKGGYPKHPAWFHNLRANPDTTVQVGSERRPCTRASPTRRSAPGCGPGWWTPTGGTRTTSARTGREIPLVILERRTS